MRISRKKFRTFFEIFVSRPSNPTVETADFWDFAGQRYFIITASRVSIEKLRQQLQRKVTLKLKFALSYVFCGYSMLVTLYKLSEVHFHFHFLGTNGFNKAKNETITYCCELALSSEPQK